MSRLSSMSAEAIRAVFSPDADSDLFILLTIYSPDAPTTPMFRLCDGFTKRLTSAPFAETADEVYYGVTWKANDFLFLPMEITLPSEQEAQAPRCSITMHDVSRYLIPMIRTITSPPKVRMDLVLSKYLDPASTSHNPSANSEVFFTEFYISNFTYNAQSVVAELTMIDYEREPFPMHSFNPIYFPGLF